MFMEDPLTPILEQYKVDRDARKIVQQVLDDVVKAFAESWKVMENFGLPYVDPKYLTIHAFESSPEGSEEFALSLKKNIEEMKAGSGNQNE